MANYRRWGTGGGGGVPAGRGLGSYNVFGLFLPKPIAWLIGVTLLFSAGGALLERNGVPALTNTLLAADAVFSGEVWRLATWTLLERDPLNLFFGCLLLYFIGPDLIVAWGARRFFLLYFGGAALVGAITCAIGRFLWTDIYLQSYLTMWAMADALLIAWGAYGQHRQMLMFFVLPIRGQHLIAFTIALTFIHALMNGFPLYLPHFIAECLALVYLDVFSIRRLYLRGRMAVLQRDYKRRTAHLRPVERDDVPRDDDKPPRWMH